MGSTAGAPGASGAAGGERRGQTLHVVSHTHWDREWYLTFQRFRLRLVRVVDDLLDLMEAGEDFRCFHLDGQAVVLEDYLELRPGNAERLGRLIASGRILVGPWYVLPDEFLISGESHVRNLIVGGQVVRRFGEPMGVGYLPDLFGHISQMPQLLRDAGLDSAVLWRGLSGEREGLPSELTWEAPDGSAVLCVHLPEQWGYSNGNDLPLNPDAAYARVEGVRAERAAVAGTSHLLLMNGTDHHGAQPELPALLRTLDDRFQEEGVRVLHARLPEFVADVRREVAAGQAKLPVRRGELRDSNRSGSDFHNYLLPGVASARVYLKQANHRAQQALERYAEPLASAAWTAGAAYPQGALTRSWKYLLQNHPHDSICGCSLDAVHEQMMTRFQWSQEIADQLAVEAMHHLNRLAARPALKEGDTPFRLFNPLPAPRREVWEASVDVPLANAAGATARAFAVLDGAGRVLPHHVLDDRVVTKTVDHADVQPAPRNVRVRALRLAFGAPLPGLGYASFVLRPLALPAWDRPAPGPSDVRVTPSSLENEHLRLEVAPNGTIALTDKATQRRLPGLLLFEDGGDAGDEYTYSPPQRDRVVSSLGCAATVSVEAWGPVLGTLRLDVTLPVPAGATADRKARDAALVPLAISTRLTVAAGSRRVEAETVVENAAEDHRLRVLFPAGLAATHHAVDQAFDVVDRPNDYPWTPAAYWSEDPPQAHPQRLFVDLADGDGGLAVFNQGIAEYAITGSPGGGRGLALTLLRCVAFLGAASYPSTIRGGAGPHLETPGAQCPGRHVFRYALRPHGGDWQAAGLVDEANAYCAPALSYPVADGTPADGAAPAAGALGLTESFLDVSGRGVTVSAVKRAEAADEREGGTRTGLLVVRLYNPSPAGAQARVRLRGGIARAWWANILEAPGEALPVGDGGADGAAGGAVRVDVGPRRILTLLLEPA